MDSKVEDKIATQGEGKTYPMTSKVEDNCSTKSKEKFPPITDKINVSWDSMGAIDSSIDMLDISVDTANKDDGPATSSHLTFPSSVYQSRLHI